MEKKRSVGVVVFSIIYILLAGLYGMFFLMGILWLPVAYALPEDSFMSTTLFTVIFLLFMLTKTILYLYGATLLLKLNKRGYRIVIPPLILCLPAFGIELPVLIAHIIFFTRPKVKEQFK